MKTCTKCKIEKHFHEFSKNRSKKDGLKSECKKCTSISVSLWKIENKERVKESARKYRENNRQKVRKATAEWNLKNIERVRMTTKAWAKMNPCKVSALSRNRRVRISSADGKHSATDIREIFEKQQGFCANCLCKLFKSGKQKFHVDHIMPLALGGSNWPANLQCLCPACNMKKHAKDPIEWAQENGRLI